MEYIRRILTNLFFTGILIFLVTGCLNEYTEKDNLSQLKSYNVIWDTPGENSLGSMPLGNGDIGLNVWVEKSGDISFYISKTDAWDDNARLVKIGKLNITLKPENGQLPPFTSQTLDLETGSVKIQYGEKSEAVNVSVWVDANNPVVNVDVDSNTPVELVARNEIWRREKDTLESISHGDIMFNPLYPNGSEAPVVVEPDRVLEYKSDRIGWYHHNIKSIGIGITAEMQGVEDIIEDPIVNRTFGAVVKAENGKADNDTTLILPPSKKQNVMVFVRTDHPATPEEWEQNVENDISSISKLSHADRLAKHEEWWKDFWNRSWIHISENSESDQVATNEVFTVSRAYTLQRFIAACSGRGNYPIKFNGSIFTVNHPGKPGGATLS